MQTNPKEKPNQTIDRNRKTQDKKMRQETSQKIHLQESIPHPIVLRSPGTLRLGFPSYGTGRSSHNDDDDDCTQQTFFPEVGGYEKPQKPPPGTTAVRTGVSPRFPTHQITGYTIRNPGSHILKPAQEPESLPRDLVVLWFWFFKAPKMAVINKVSQPPAQHCFIPWLYIHSSICSWYSFFIQRGFIWMKSWLIPLSRFYSSIILHLMLNDFSFLHW
jgi:hypothetical protein